LEVFKLVCYRAILARLAVAMMLKDSDQPANFAGLASHATVSLVR